MLTGGMSHISCCHTLWPGQAISCCYATIEGFCCVRSRFCNAVLSIFRYCHPLFHPSYSPYSLPRRRGRQWGRRMVMRGRQNQHPVFGVFSTIKVTLLHVSSEFVVLCNTYLLHMPLQPPRNDENNAVADEIKDCGEQRGRKDTTTTLFHQKGERDGVRRGARLVGVQSAHLLLASASKDICHDHLTGRPLRLLSEVHWRIVASRNSPFALRQPSFCLHSPLSPPPLASYSTSPTSTTHG